MATTAPSAETTGPTVPRLRRPRPPPRRHRRPRRPVDEVLPKSALPDGDRRARRLVSERERRNGGERAVQQAEHHRPFPPVAGVKADSRPGTDVPASSSAPSTRTSTQPTVLETFDRGAKSSTTVDRRRALPWASVDPSTGDQSGAYRMSVSQTVCRHGVPSSSARMLSFCMRPISLRYRPASGPVPPRHTTMVQTIHPARPRARTHHDRAVGSTAEQCAHYALEDLDGAWSRLAVRGRTATVVRVSLARQPPAGSTQTSEGSPQSRPRSHGSRLLHRLGVFARPHVVTSTSTRKDPFKCPHSVPVAPPVPDPAPTSANRVPPPFRRAA